MDIMQTQSTQPITHIYLNNTLTECPDGCTEMGALDVFYKAVDREAVQTDYEERAQRIGVQPNPNAGFSFVYRRVRNVMVYVPWMDAHADRDEYHRAMEHLRNACDSVLAEDTLSRLNVVTVTEDDGVYLAELLVVVKEGKAPHYFNAAGHTEANARIRLQGVLNDATILMRVLGAETSTVNKIRDIAKTLRVGAKAEAIKEILKAQVSIALGTSSDGGAS